MGSWHHKTSSFLYLQITRSDNRQHVKLAVSLMIADGHFDLPLGFVYMGNLLTTLSALRISSQC